MRAATHPSHAGACCSAWAGSACRAGRATRLPTTGPWCDASRRKCTPTTRTCSAPAANWIVRWRNWKNVWDRLRHAPEGHGGDPLRVRETAALAAVARWCYGAALERQESRGLHQRSDAPAQRVEFDLHLRSGGLDRPWVRRDGLPASTWTDFENRSHNA
ncbi:hypothetical protein ACFS3C_10935 [Azotobacter vinelandii]